MQYRMLGAQRIVLEDGSSIEPGSGEFSANISPAREAWFLKIGALAKVEGSAAADNKAADDSTPVVNIRTRRKE